MALNAQDISALLKVMTDPKAAQALLKQVADQMQASDDRFAAVQKAAAELEAKAQDLVKEATEVGEKVAEAHRIMRGAERLRDTVEARNAALNSAEALHREQVNQHLAEVAEYIKAKQPLEDWEKRLTEKEASLVRREEDLRTGRRELVERKQALDTLLGQVKAA